GVNSLDRIRFFVCAPDLCTGKCPGAERKAGDVTVIDTSRGAQVLYYEGVGVPYWQVLARQNTYNKRYEALLNELEKTYAYTLEDAVLQSVQGKAMVG
ncbi:MAG: hypothetical protein IIX61_00350, partial [Loktanella sp.]|nr:hypothetical protein [Loktanella sp.]